MSNKKLVGTAFIIVGVLLIVWGYNMQSSIGGQLSSALSGGGLSWKVITAYVVGVVVFLGGIKQIK